MAMKISDDEVWHWHELMIRFSQQDLPQSQFCKANGINYKQFCSKFRRIFYIQKTNPNLYNKLKPLCEAMLAAGGTGAELARKHGLRLKDVSEMCTHLRYWESINRLKKERESTMKFIQVPAVQPRIPVVHEPEVLKKQNDVELVISAGVKVVVAPEVGADKLIRIIELLKDL